MHVGSILVGFVLLAALGAVVARPWWRPGMPFDKLRTTQRATHTSSSDPREEYEALVAAIRDLDFDYRAGVVTETDYRPLRDDLAARAVALMQELDRQPSEEADSAAATSIDEQIEAAVSALRTHRHAEPRSTGNKGTRGQGEGERGSRHPVTPSPRHPLSPSPLHPRTPARFVCPECGHRARADSRFCARCGAKLEPSCPNCHGPVEPEDRFCGTCGQMLVEEVAAA